MSEIHCFNGLIVFHYYNISCYAQNEVKTDQITKYSVWNYEATRESNSINV